MSRQGADPGPRALRPLPTQPDGVDWPTDEWPEGRAQAVDRARLDAELDRAFGPDPVDLGQSLALLVVQGGRLVAERYAPDVEAATTLLSWSMAKSMLQAAVGKPGHGGCDVGGRAGARPRVERTR